MSTKERNVQSERFLSVKQFSSFKQITKFSEHYKIGKELGSGAFGTVKIGTHRVSGVPCAIKIIKKSSLAVADVYKDLMRNELEVLEATNHPHITRVFELMEDQRNYYIIMELITGGNLLDMVYKEKNFTEAKAAEVIR